MTKPIKRIFKSLPLRMVAPVVMVICLVGVGLYFFVLKSVSEFADEQIKEALTNITREVYDICDENFTELMQGGQMDNQKAVTIKKAIALGSIEEHIKKINTGCLLTDPHNGELLRHQIEPGLMKFIIKHHSKGIASTVHFKGKIFYFQHFTFKPWGWHVDLIKDTKAYIPLVARVKLAYIVTGILLSVGLVLILFIQERLLRRPLNRIISSIQMGDPPEYKGIHELEFLSDNISKMMQSLEERNKWVEYLYRIAITHRGKDFFNRVADALSEALEVNTLILRSQPSANKFHPVAFSRIDARDNGLFDPSSGLPSQQIATEKKPIIITSGACVQFPFAQSLSDTNAESYAGMPILNRKGSVTGIMNVFGKKREYDEWDLNLIKTVCQMVAVEFEFLEKESDKLRLEGQLQQLQRMEAIGTLAGGIAHDFNNILFPVVGYTEMLMDDIPADSPLRPFLTEILKGTLRAKDLVKQILTFSRQSEEKQKPLKIQTILKEVLKLSRSTLPTTIDIQMDIPDERCVIMADPTQIHQIAMNLITNAFHAMEETGGTLTISLEKIDFTPENLPESKLSPGPYICLTVSDTGSGMDIKTQERIFEPYFTTKKKEKGTGLGLALVHGIVQTYEGAILVQSKPGKGSSFMVYLPRIASDVDYMVKVSPKVNQTGKEHILFVDDEKNILIIVKQILERLNYQVTSRNSSLDALETFQSDPDLFDLVITDMTMPHMTGDKLSMELKRIRSDIPIILCTGFSEKVSNGKHSAIGIDKVLMKPIVKDALADAVREVLDNKQISGQ